MSAASRDGYRWIVQAASESPQPPASGRLHRARALYRNVSKRRTAWLLLKDTVNSCMEYRILGLAAEAAFFTLLSVPPLLRLGGSGLVFGTFAAVFVVAALTAFVLPELRGRSLDDVVPTPVVNSA